MLKVSDDIQEGKKENETMSLGNAIKLAKEKKAEEELKAKKDTGMFSILGASLAPPAPPTE